MVDTSAPDDTLLAEARAGDRAALEALLERYQTPVYGFGMKICGNPEDAKDVLQETLLTMARDIHNFRGKSSLSTWLYTIARNACIRMHRRSKFAPEVESSLEIDAATEAKGIADPAHSAEEVLARKQVERALAQAIDELDPIYREVDANNQVVWSLDYAKLVTPPSGATGDWCHANAITVDLVKNVVYANCRWAGLLKTTYATTPVRQWLLTGKGKGSSVPTQPTSDIAFSPTSSAFSDTHDPEIHDDGTICFFDNGGYSGGAGGSTSMFQTRAVEYKIDETAKTATKLWSYNAMPNINNVIMGDVQRMPNGNTIVAYSTQGVVHEVDATGTLLQQLSWGTGGAIGYIIKRPTLYGKRARMGLGSGDDVKKGHGNGHGHPKHV